VFASFRRSAVAVLSMALFVTALLLTGCSDDPVLGPEGPSDDGGGSYGVINQFAPGDSTDDASNPETF